jgi:hypothetical protein
MLAALLRGTDWSKIADYLSPELFHVVPPLSMAKQLQSLVKSYRNHSDFAALKDTLGSLLSQSGWGIQIGDKVAQTKNPSTESLSLGDRILRLYFWQLLSQPAAILDVRSKGWKKNDDGTYLWNPSPLYIAWDDDFLTAVRHMYRGFYQNDEALLDQGLDAIGMKPGKAALMQHFGLDQARVSFEMTHFRSSFHEIFLACKEGKTRLHPNVLGLGAVLACLYEHMEILGGGYDVRAAFLDAEKLLAGTKVPRQETRYAT